MQAKWIFSSTFLPCTGEPIDFLLEDRSEPLHGTFDNGIFHSRWADYSANRVQSWRGSDGAGTSSPIATPKAAKVGAFVAMMKRFSNALPGRSKAIPIQPHSRRRTVTTIAAAPARSPVFMRRIAGSNQMSS